MVDAVLHAGTEHPSLVWIVVASLLTFVAGLGLGAYWDRVRAVLGLDRGTEEAAVDEPAN